MDTAILCTIDFSESSKDVLQYAVNLSKQLKCHIRVLYTYRLLSASGDEAVDMRKKTEEQAKLNFSVLEKEVLTGSGISYDFKIEVGFVSNRVREYAKNNNVSFLVMGKGMNGTSKESFDELAANLQVPLVIVP
jgi:nucleotide-binding universal stress UspA family protein